MTTLPEWMLPTDVSDDWESLPKGLKSAPHASRRRTIRRAIGGFSKMLAGVISDDETAARHGLLQGIDARFKVVGLIGLVVVATLVRSIWALAAFYGICIGLAALSRVPIKRLAGVWLVVPLFSAAIILPATLNVVTHGKPLWVIWRFSEAYLGPWRLPQYIAVTDSGLFTAGRFVLRTAVCVSLTMLLACTTPRPKLFHGLRAIGVPKIFIALLAMMERYLGVLLRAAEEIHLAKISRSIIASDLRNEQAWVASGIGSLFRRAYSLSQLVYMAMISRGYTGEVRLLDPPRSRRRDWMFLASVVAVSAVLGLMIK